MALADRAYSSRAIRAHLREGHVRAVVPQPVEQVRHRERRGSNSGRPPAFEAERTWALAHRTSFFARP